MSIKISGDIFIHKYNKHLMFLYSGKTQIQLGLRQRKNALFYALISNMVKGCRLTSFVKLLKDIEYLTSVFFLCECFRFPRNLGFCLSFFRTSSAGKIIA